MIEQYFSRLVDGNFLKTPAEKRITIDHKGKVVRDCFTEEASVSSTERGRNSQLPSFSFQCNMQKSSFCASLLLSTVLEAIQIIG